MSQTLFFYDLETSGFNPRSDRIMQFGGQRTDLELKPIGKAYRHFIKLTPDVVPSPDAILVTGITPQQTISEGLSEKDFLELFYEEIAIPDTIFVGFNNIRFDDEFIRFLNYRNFYDAYEWHWADGKSRWDLLDVVRMTRALRPEGIKWPMDSKGQASNQLTLLSSINNLPHDNAHDALSDVMASLHLAQLLKLKQPKLFEFMLEHRDKQKVAALVQSGKPFVYTSGKYSSEFEKTTIVSRLVDHPNKNGALVYDLHYDPGPFFSLKPDELAEMWKHYCHERPCPHPRLPVKTLQFNRCPAVAPLSVFDKDSEKRLHLPLKIVEENLKNLKTDIANFSANLLKALELLDKRQQTELLTNEQTVDDRLYEGFITTQDKTKMSEVRSVSPEELPQLQPTFSDDRLKGLLPLYKARNYPKLLTDDERLQWQRFLNRRLLGGKQNSLLATYFKRLEELTKQFAKDKSKLYLLEELKLYGESVIPDDAD